MRPLTCRDAGVDIDAGDESVRRIAPLARRTARPEVLGGIGAFAAFARVNDLLVHGAEPLDFLDDIGTRGVEIVA